jgi:squalene synthase HpnC
MTVSTVQQLDLYGPERCETMTVEQARQMCLRLACGRYENFSVLSAVVPKRLRSDFAAVYAFCRWADDLGDEIGDPERSLSLLSWWRRELHQCFAGEPRHPVFIALLETIRRHDLPIKPFDDLIRAFEQDQMVTRYQTWDQLIDYCRLSADPVGRIVLMLFGQERSERIFSRSDCICTALQLTNHWQDIRRDIVERNRIYIPSELVRIERFEERLIGSARQGYAVDHQFLGETCTLVRQLVQRTWPLYEKGEQLLNLIKPEARPVVWLLAAGGHETLRMIESWNYETALHRPQLSKFTKLMLIVRAWIWGKRQGRRVEATS